MADVTRAQPQRASGLGRRRGTGAREAIASLDHTPLTLGDAAQRTLDVLGQQRRVEARFAPVGDEVARALEVSENTYHRWQRQYGGMKADDAKRLKELERENATLKRIVADKELENVALREIAKGNW